MKIKHNNTAVLIDAGYFSKLSNHFGNGNYLKIVIIAFSKYLAIKSNFWLKLKYS